MTARRKRRQKNLEPTELPIAEVVWVDAEECGDIGWNELDELLEKAAEPCPVMRSVGYVLHHCEDHISLISTIGPDECGSLEKIPAEFLKSVTYMKGEKG
jgi:transposase